MLKVKFSRNIVIGIRQSKIIILSGISANIVEVKKLADITKTEYML